MDPFGLFDGRPNKKLRSCAPETLSFVYEKADPFGLRARPLPASAFAAPGLFAPVGAYDEMASEESGSVESRPNKKLRICAPETLYEKPDPFGLRARPLPASAFAGPGLFAPVAAYEDMEVDSVEVVHMRSASEESGLVESRPNKKLRSCAPETLSPESADPFGLRARPLPDYALAAPGSFAAVGARDEKTVDHPNKKQRV